MTTLFRKVDYTLSGLLHEIEFGNLALPDIQRPFVWTPAKVRDLFDSMYKGFPTGYLLFWANQASNGTRSIGISSKQAPIPRLLIVDGQQRLTSLYAVLKGIPVLTQDYKELYIQIAFRPIDASFEVADAATTKNPEFISDISKLWTEYKSSFKAISSFIQNLAKSREVGSEEESFISNRIDRLFDLQNYPFTAMEILPTVDEEQVADIFVRINSKGVQLRQADFILTLLSVFWDEGRFNLEAFCRESRISPSNNRPSPFNYFIQPEPDQLLRVAVAVGFRRARLQYVYLLLRGKDLDSGEFSDERRYEQFEILKEAQSYVLNLQNWHDFLRILLRAGFRSSSMISSEMGIIYSYAMFLIGRYVYEVEEHVLKTTMARWFFMIAITARYSSSPESAMDEDLARLRSASTAEDFVSTLNNLIYSELTHDFWELTLPNYLETAAARSPYMFAYYAALNLLEANVLFSPLKVSALLDPATKAYRSAVERHHLFPKNYLRSLGYEGTRETNQAANYALVEWGDNMSITDRPPSEYFPEYAARFSNQDLEKMMWWHALPENWHEMSYEDFLAERRKLIAQVTKQGFETL